MAPAPFISPTGSAVGVAAATSQFTEQTANVLSWLFKYLKEVKQAPKLAKEFRNELFAVHQVLEELESAYEILPHIQNPNVLTSSVSDFLTTMTDIQKALEIKEGLIDSKRFMWSFIQKDMEKYLSKLERYKNTFSLALGAVQRYA